MSVKTHYVISNVETSRRSQCAGHARHFFRQAMGTYTNIIASDMTESCSSLHVTKTLYRVKREI